MGLLFSAVSLNTIVNCLRLYLEEKNGAPGYLTIGKEMSDALALQERCGAVADGAFGKNTARLSLNISS